MGAVEFLKAGEIFFSKKGDRIDTVLGSCIAICIYDRMLKIGGMCHYKLPGNHVKVGNITENYNYALSAIPALLKKLKEAGSSKDDIEAKIVGGANIALNGETSEEGIMIVGSENVKMAYSLLNRYKIRIVAEKTGGATGKQVRFYSDSGQIQVKNLKRAITGGISSKVGIKTGFKANKVTETNQSQKKIKVLIVDDSKPIRIIIRKMIEMNPKMEVLHEAKSAEEAEEFIKVQRPDVITLDINMPGIDGVTFLRKLMKTDPIPTIMISALNYSESGPVFESLEIGAFDYIKKPAFENLQGLSTELHEKITAAYTSKYITKQGQNIDSRQNSIQVNEAKLSKYLIAIGSSTGGTMALTEMLTKLPANIPPIVITQHIPPVFSRAFAERLNQICPFKVKEAETGDIISSGNVFVAPGGKHMKIVEKGTQYIIKLTDDAPVNRFKPSVDYLFDSIVENVKTKNILGFLLTGMGKDGASGLLNLKNYGATTVVQNEETCVVYGMPKVAYDMGAADEKLPLYEMANFIVDTINKK